MQYVWGGVEKRIESSGSWEMRVPIRKGPWCMMMYIRVVSIGGD